MIADLRFARRGPTVAAVGIVLLTGLATGCSSTPADAGLAPGHYTLDATAHGPESLDVTADGYTQNVSIYTHFGGSLAAGSDGVTFTETGRGQCTGQPGTYRVTPEPNGVRFALVNDPCPPRAQDLPAGVWTRQG